MRNEWLLIASVGVVSVLAGVAIAGTPNSEAVEATIAVPERSVPEETLPPVETTTTTTEVPAPTSTVAEQATTTTSPAATTTTTTTEPLPDRAGIFVVAVNGAGVSGIAGATRTELIDLGYVEVRTTDGTLIDVTTVYFAPGLEREAGVVLLDLGLDVFGGLPMADAPSFGQLDGDEIAVYIGRDRS